MCQHIALTNNLIPGNFRVSLPKLFGNVIGSLTNNQHGTFHGVPDHVIADKLFIGYALNKLANLPGFFTHIPQISQISFFRTHTPPVLC